VEKVLKTPPQDVENPPWPGENAVENLLPVENSRVVTGRTIQWVLVEEDMSQAEFGRRFGKKQSIVSRWIRGEAPIPPIVRHTLSCPQCYAHFVQGHALADSELEDG
jgi:hypothetical protein